MADTQFASLAGYPQNLADLQVNLEMEMRCLSKERSESELKSARDRGEESTTPYGVTLLKGSIGHVATGIEKFVQDAMSGKAGRKNLSATLLAQADSEAAALITGRVILNFITQPISVQQVAINIGGMIEDEVRFRTFRKDLPGLWISLNRHMRTQHNAHRRRVLTRAMNRTDKPWVSWGKVEKLHLGIKLIELFIEHTGMVEIVTVYTGPKCSKLHLRATPATLAWIEDKIGKCELLTPVYLPTVVPPKDWEGPYGGGYHSNAVWRLSLVKTRNKEYLEELRHRVEEMAPVYTAVNALQRTAWKVNQQVLTIMRDLWDRGLCVAGLPNRDALPLPNSPVEGKDKEEMTEDERGDFIKWKRSAASIHDLNFRMGSKRLQAAQTVHIANKFKDAEAIHFPYQLDFRGRIYAVPMFLNPQGNDIAKGLLMFAHGKPIGDAVAAGWLAVHGANLWAQDGVDKLTLEGRIDWVEANNALISATAEDPLADLWWTEAEDPWQFLGFIFEWAGFLAQGFSFVSSLPVALDGSCNGLQHFSAMLRDKIGGTAVNLTASAKPQDIYQAVADRVTAKLRLDLSEGGSEGELAGMWLSFCDNAIPRSCTKRSVMVLPYGGTLFSCRDFTQDFIREQVEGGKPSTFGEEQFSAALYLAKHIWQSIGEVVIAAREAMGWLQKAARLLAKEEMPICWTTPSGFPVMQAYPNMKTRRVETAFGDTILKLSVNEDVATLDARRQTNGISPNFVHSMDAAALVLSVDLAQEMGIGSFAMVHDSYGTLAADTNLLARCLRVAFVDMYENNDVLDQFREEVGLILAKGQTLPELPPQGELDLRQVLESDFFFA